MQAFSKVKEDSASRHQEQIFQRNDGILIMNKRKQNICSELHHFIDAQRSPRRSSAWLTSHLSNFRGTDSNRRQMDLLVLLANVYFAVDELARELKDKSKGYKTKPSRATVRKTYPKNLPPKYAFRSLTNAATAATTRDSASLLSNKRIRGVADGGNGLMHLRPRVSTYSAVTKNPCRYRRRHIGAFCLHSKRSAGRRNWQSTVCRDWPR